MIVVIIAGGSGTRLWPLSTPEYPKHLLKLVGDESLMQSAYQRAKKLTDKIYVITEAGHAHRVREQLPDLPEDNFIIEPGRRGTAGCIIAGLHHVGSRHDNDEPIAFIHADHVIHDVDGFTYSFQIAAKSATEHQRITLIGIEPTFPSTGFGYIQKGEVLHDGGLVYKVVGFKEKPDHDTANEYIKSGRYLWNCGYFVGSVTTFVRDFKAYSPQWGEYYDRLNQSSEADYKDTYLSFKNDTIDYALMEPDTNLQVVPANFDWMDLGSFVDLYAAVESDNDGNYVEGEKIALEMVQNSFIRNDDPARPVGVIGLDNVVVVNTPNGILVARKDLAQKVKDIANKLKA